MRGQLGFYTLAGHTNSPRDLVQECLDAEALGLDAAFISERFNLKEAATLCGAAGAVTERLRIATGATNPNTRHPLITATFATTMHRLTGGRFSLGLGRGFGALFDAIGAPRVNMAMLGDHASILRRLWHGETIFGHDGPAGKYPYLGMDPSFDEDIPLLLTALGPRTIEFAGRVFDGVILHTFFADETLARCVELARRGATEAGKDPDAFEIWSVLAVVHDPDRSRYLKAVVARLATYLQGYGDLLVRVNGWDPTVLDRFRADEFVQGFRGALDAVASDDELEHVASLLPQEWIDASAIGSAEFCAQRVEQQFDLGATGVILHGATPSQLTEVVAAHRSR
jgi:probable F420-dependent oxidoreductase